MDFRGGEGGIYATGLIPPLPTGRPNNTCGFVFKEIRYHRKRKRKKERNLPPPISPSYNVLWENYSSRKCADCFLLFSLGIVT